MVETVEEQIAPLARRQLVQVTRLLFWNNECTDKCFLLAHVCSATPGRPERLPAQAPLRTVLESFPSHGSSLSMDIALCGMSRLGKSVARSALNLIQPLPYSSRADLLGNPYAGPETHQSTGVDRHLLFSVRTVPSSF